MIELIAGGMLALVSFGIGARVGRLSRPAPPVPARPPETVCGCEHDLSHHDPSSNRCFAVDPEPKYNAIGHRIGNQSVQCTCRQYTGPRPIEQVFQPRVVLPREEA